MKFQSKKMIREKYFPIPDINSGQFPASLGKQGNRMLCDNVTEEVFFFFQEKRTYKLSQKLLEYTLLKQTIIHNNYFSLLKF